MHSVVSLCSGAPAHHQRCHAHGAACMAGVGTGQDSREQLKMWTDGWAVGRLVATAAVKHTVLRSHMLRRQALLR
jgi:hypothetical protein